MTFDQSTNPNLFLGSGPVTHPGSFEQQSGVTPAPETENDNDEMSQMPAQLLSVMRTLLENNKASDTEEQVETEVLQRGMPEARSGHIPQTGFLPAGMPQVAARSPSQARSPLQAVASPEPMAQVVVRIHEPTEVPPGRNALFQAMSQSASRFLTQAQTSKRTNIQPAAMPYTATRPVPQPGHSQAAGAMPGTMPHVAVRAPTQAENQMGALLQAMAGPSFQGDSQVAEAMPEPMSQTAVRAPTQAENQFGALFQAMAQAAAEATPQAATGTMSQAAVGAMPQAALWAMSQAAAGAMPQAALGAMPQSAAGAMPQAPTGTMSQAALGAMLQAAAGAMPQTVDGVMSQAGAGAMPQTVQEAISRAASGAMPQVAGAMPQAAARSAPQATAWAMPQQGGAMPQTAWTMSQVAPGAMLQAGTPNVPPGTVPHPALMIPQQEITAFAGQPQPNAMHQVAARAPTQARNQLDAGFKPQTRRAAQAQVTNPFATEALLQAMSQRVGSGDLSQSLASLRESNRNSGIAPGAGAQRGAESHARVVMQPEPGMGSFSNTRTPQGKISASNPGLETQNMDTYKVLLKLAANTPKDGAEPVPTASIKFQLLPKNHDSQNGKSTPGIQDARPSVGTVLGSVLTPFQGSGSGMDTLQRQPPFASDRSPVSNFQRRAPRMDTLQGKLHSSDANGSPFAGTIPGIAMLSSMQRSVALSQPGTVTRVVATVGPASAHVSMARPMSRTQPVASPMPAFGTVARQENAPDSAMMASLGSKSGIGIMPEFNTMFGTGTHGQAYSVPKTDARSGAANPQRLAIQMMAENMLKMGISPASVNVPGMGNVPAFGAMPGTGTVSGLGAMKMPETVQTASAKSELEAMSELIATNLRAMSMTPEESGMGSAPGSFMVPSVGVVQGGGNMPDRITNTQPASQVYESGRRTTNNNHNLSTRKGTNPTANGKSALIFSGGSSLPVPDSADTAATGSDTQDTREYQYIDFIIYLYSAWYILFYNFSLSFIFDLYWFYLSNVLFQTHAVNISSLSVCLSFSHLSCVIVL